MNKTRFVLALLTLGGGLVSCPSFAQGPNTNLPYSDNFESYTNGTPLTDGTNGWYSSSGYASSNNAVVQTNVIKSGTNAAMVPVDVTLSNRFTNVASTNVWIQMDILPVLYDAEEIPLVDSNAATMFFVNSNGYFVVQHTNAPGTNWVTITNTVSGSAATPVSNEWVRIDMYQNYSNRTWMLFADYILMKDNISFVNTNIANFSGFDLYNGSESTIFLDNVLVTTTNPPDIGADGGNWLPDTFVSLTNLTRTVAQGQQAVAQSFEIWKTSGYYSLTYTNTASTNWLSASPSSGTSTGEHDTIAVTYTNTSTLVARTDPYAATIQVDGMDSQFGFTAKNSPCMIRVQVYVKEGPVLSVSPASLMQTVSKGGNPTNQAFFVSNVGAEPRIAMNYTLSRSVSWLSLSAYSGVSTGEQDRIGVMFSDMSGYATGTNTGTIRILATDDTGEGTGVLTQETSIAVTVVITAPDAPTGVTASDGTDAGKVIVSWNASDGAMRYEVWRHTAFDISYAYQLADVTTTNYDDNSASPGLLYYYWVKPVSPYGVVGGTSLSDTGYRALSAPGGLFASDGTYTNKVRVTWSASDGAESYELYRGPVGQTPSNVYHSGSLSYDDFQVETGVQYSYKVASKNSRYSSALSTSDVGYALSPPLAVSASDGVYIDRVNVSWNAAESATGYEVWRGTVDLSSRAELLGSTTDAEYDDTTLTSGTIYYYWVKAKNATVTSGFSGSDSGYAASGGVDLLVWGLVLLPNTIGTGASPSVVSFRLSNEGSRSMISPDTAVGMDFYASANQTFGDDDDVVIGQVSKDITLLARTNTVVMVEEVSHLAMPATAGDYYIFVKVDPIYPSTLVDSNPGNNVTMREEPVHVSGSETLSYHAINDYDGDGVSDLVVVNDGLWYIRSVDGQVIGMGLPWGGTGFEAVCGDYDGDGISDPAVYGGGMWFARSMAGEVILWAQAWGGSGFEPVYGTFSGTNAAGVDLVVYHEQSGTWYVRTVGGDLVLWGVSFGQSGYTPVSGDYDGDQIWDLAVYHEETGTWYVRRVDGELVLWGESWGGLGYEPVSGDYDGDGVWDMAVYYEAAGMWFIRTASGDGIVWAQTWGGAGYQPVFGDYNGDGLSDMAVYHETSGKWYVLSTDGTVVLWDSLWGGPGYKPVER